MKLIRYSKVKRKVGWPLAIGQNECEMMMHCFLHGQRNLTILSSHAHFIVFLDERQGHQWHRALIRCILFVVYLLSIGTRAPQKMLNTHFSLEIDRFPSENSSFKLGECLFGQSSGRQTLFTDQNHRHHPSNETTKEKKNWNYSAISRWSDEVQWTWTTMMTESV